MRIPFTISLLIGSLSYLSPCFSQPYQTLGAGSCGLGQNNCHTKENDWWSADEHYTTNERFYNSAKAVDIAKAYGITPQDSKRSNSNCMTCHGTVITADLMKKPVPEPETGVSCENCHGAGSGYKENHSSEKGRGYEIGIKFGMKANKQMPVRAQMCVSCHLITSAKLPDRNDANRIAGNHSDGKKFDYGKGLQKTAKHFRTPDTEDVRILFLAEVARAKQGSPLPPSVMAARVETKPLKPVAPSPKRVEQPLPEKAPPPKIPEVVADDVSAMNDSSVSMAIKKTFPEDSAFTNPLSTFTPVQPAATQFVAPFLPLTPPVKLRKKLVLPREPSFIGARTRADSILILTKYLNAVLQAVEEAK